MCTHAKICLHSFKSYSQPCTKPKLHFTCIHPVRSESSMFKANYFLFLVAIVFSPLVRGHDEAAKITPTSISNLRGNISRYLYSEGVKEGFIDIEGFDVNSTSIEIQFFEDELTHTFTFIKKIVHHSNGFYWYGREENRGSNLNLLVKDRTQGKRFTG